MEKKKQTNITHLNQYSTNKTLDTIRKQKRKKFVHMRTSILLGVGVLLIGIAGLPLINNIQKTNEFNHLYAEAASTLDDLEQEKAQLEYEVGLLEDEEYIAKLARKELNVSKENEILINLPEEETESEDADAEKNEAEENESEEHE